MGKYLVKKVAMMIFTLFIISTLTFFMSYLLPGGPYQNPQKMTPQLKVVFDAKYGLDKPVPVQYAKYLGRLVQGDLGMSYRYMNRSVNDIIKETFPVSGQLGLQAILLGLPLGLLFGIVSALYRGKTLDYALVFLAIIGVSVPSMVLATLFRQYLGLEWGFFPVARWGTFAHTVLPTLALSVSVIALITRIMRTSMLDVLSSDYLRTAKSKGLSDSVVIWKHGIRNALLPVITVFGTLVVNIITGSLVIEDIFAVPGMGRHFVNSINNNDYTLVMGLTIFYSFLFIAAIFITDIAYGLIDPRIRVVGGKE
ncbi:ABC transporter permease [Tepidibacillus marianensis]|uniref:ABC transporter permease n=1 Tax=Tepidibacillus marianensis TaxID=3131995 RepID=UPI0030CCCE70